MAAGVHPGAQALAAVGSMAASAHYRSQAVPGRRCIRGSARSVSAGLDGAVAVDIAALKSPAPGARHRCRIRARVVAYGRLAVVGTSYQIRPERFEAHRDDKTVVVRRAAAGAVEVAGIAGILVASRGCRRMLAVCARCC